MDIRALGPQDLTPLLGLYTQLHPQDLPLPGDAEVQAVWTEALAHPGLRYFGGFVDGMLVSTCHIAIVPNLTRGCRLRTC